MGPQECTLFTHEVICTLNLRTNNITWPILSLIDEEHEVKQLVYGDMVSKES